MTVVNNHVHADSGWVVFWAALVGAVVGAAVGGAISFGLEWYRNRRSAEAAALLIHHSLKMVSAALAAAFNTASSIDFFGTRRFLASWQEHSDALARYVSPEAWQLVAKAFTAFDALSFFQAGGLDSSTTLSPQELALIPDAIAAADEARLKLETLFSIPEDLVVVEAADK